MPADDGPKPREISLPSAFAVLLSCQLAGEVLVTLMRPVTFPGPVVGMALYLLVLFIRRGPGASEDAAAGGILKNLSLLFVPAAVGIIQHGETIRTAGLALALAIMLSTAATLIVTVFTFIGVRRLMGISDDA